jgi:hypothetical protein
MYVWFDALTNYLSGIEHPAGSNARFWPADVQLIGKDIVWFHSIIWPALLLSAGLPLPKAVVAHGFVHGPDGRKMSKSIGNVVDPMDVLERHAVDVFRFFLVGMGRGLGWYQWGREGVGRTGRWGGTGWLGGGAHGGKGGGGSAVTAPRSIDSVSPCRCDQRFSMYG